MYNSFIGNSPPFLHKKNTTLNKRSIFITICIFMQKENKISFENNYTVNFLNIRTPQKFVVITLTFELCGSTIG